MRISLSGRFGIVLILFAAAADVVLRLIWLFDNPQFGEWRPSDAYLPFVLLLGLILFLQSISIAVQGKRAASLAKFPLTTVGPQPPELRREAGRVGSREHYP
ncbi:MAG: hypothetical protein LAO04_07740 [Acidobacteriia bacterium]|nr:hypothetical protein [Terriglobia bacterium]